MEEYISEVFDGHSHTVQLVKERLSRHILKACELIYSALKHGNKIILCGNGGSAADSQHIAAEFVGRFQIDRNPLPAIALTVDSSIITSIGNDFNYKDIFSRQIKAHANQGDVLIAYSTSGNSENILEAVKAANKLGCSVICLSGNKGGRLISLEALHIIVPSKDTARIQECHSIIGHILCGYAEKKMFSNA